MICRVALRGVRTPYAAFASQSSVLDVEIAFLSDHRERYDMMANRTGLACRRGWSSRREVTVAGSAEAGLDEQLTLKETKENEGIDQQTD